MKSFTKKLLCILCILFLSLNAVPVDCFAATYSPLVITKQPEDIYAPYGTNITFKISATATPGYDLYYQWYYRTSPSANWIKSNGATKSDITSVFYRGMDNWQVACLVSDGKTLRASNIATVHYRLFNLPTGSTPSTPGVPENPEDSDNKSDNSGDTVPDISDSTTPEDPFLENTPAEDLDEAEKNDTVIDEVIPGEVIDELPEEGIIIDIENGDSTEEQEPDDQEIQEPENQENPEIQEPENQENQQPSVNPDLSSRPSVTPEEFGAKGDGVTDDTVAIQRAVDSGKDVVFSNNKTYYISANNYITINNKTNFRMSGGIIHKAASGSNYNLFVLRGCRNCTFENMYIYSEMTCKDIMVPAGHTRPTNINSNVLAFSGINNSDIQFINNSFANLSADYWFNGNGAGTWSNITVDGWTSSTSLMPMYAQFITGLTVRNANVSMNPIYSGNGDHCIYMCTKASNINICDSVFNWYGDRTTSRGVIAVLTFHGGSASAGTQPKNILISNCTVNSGDGKTVYTGEGVSVNIDNCNLNYSGSASATNVATLCGYGSYTVNGSHLSGYDTLVDVRGTATLANCTLDGANVNGIFGTAANVNCYSCEFNIGKGLLYYVSNGSGVNHSYIACTINKSSKGVGYVVSKRSTAGTISFKYCTIDCGGGMFMYNGGRVTMNGLTFDNCQILNSSMLGTAAEKKAYTSVGSTCNGTAI